MARRREREQGVEEEREVKDERSSKRGPVREGGPSTEDAQESEGPRAVRGKSRERRTGDLGGSSGGEASTSTEEAKWAPAC